MSHSYFCSTPKCFSLAASCAGSFPDFVFAVYFIDADLSCLSLVQRKHIYVSSDSAVSLYHILNDNFANPLIVSVFH